MHYIDLKFVRLASAYLVGWKESGSGVFRFRCPLCGDSEKSARKARGYIYTIDNSAAFKCHNCGASMGLADFLSHVNPSLASQFKFEKFIKPNKRPPKERVDPTVFSTGVKLEPKKSTLLDKMTRISELDPDHPGAAYLRSRKIPEKFFNDIYWCSDVIDLQLSIDRYKSDVDPTSKRVGAIAVPYIGENGLEYINLRYLDGYIRYQVLEVEGGQKIWGRNYVDWSKHVWVFEGAFDAMFIDNSIAVGGVSLLSILKYLRENCRGGFTLVFDSDYTSNAQVFLQLRKAIDQNCSVVIFDKHFAGKDVNQAIENGWSIEQVHQYLVSRTFRGLGARLALAQIKPPISRKHNGKEKETSKSGLLFQRLQGV